MAGYVRLRGFGFTGKSLSLENHGTNITSDVYSDLVMQAVTRVYAHTGERVRARKGEGREKNLPK